MENEAKPMNEEVVADLLGTLKKIKYALEERDAVLLKELSNHTMHISSIYHEKRTIYIAMIAYSLSKIIEKKGIERIHKEELNDFITGIVQNFGALMMFLEERDFQKVTDAIKGMLKEISEFDSSFGRYIEDILEFSKIQKGAKVYEHGLSLSSVAEMIGVSKWDLMKKIGEIKEHEEIETPRTVKERFERIKKMVKK